MSRTSKSDEIRDAFINVIRAQGVSVESVADLASTEANSIIRDLFLELGRAGREIYLVRGVGFINVHIRSESPGWWNIVKSVKADLDHLAKEYGLKTYYVLLVGRDDRHIANGYVATDFLSSPFIRLPREEEIKFTVKAKQHLDPRKYLLSVEKVARVLLQSPQEDRNSP